MTWIWALVIVVVVYLAANFVVRRVAPFSSSLSSESLDELVSKRDGSICLLDVRSVEEYRGGHIPSAINIPHDSIAARPPRVAKDSTIVVYCDTGSRSFVARRVLRRLGFANVVNFGPVRRWKGDLVRGSEPGAAAGPAHADGEPR